MRPLYLIVAATLAIASHTYAQEAAEQPQQSEQPAATEAPVRRAVPRGTAPGAAAPAEGPRGASRPEAQRVEATGAADDQRRAEPRGSRPQGDNPRTGTAVPRAARPVPRSGPTSPAPAQVDRRRADNGRNGRRTVIVRPPAVYNNYYNYSRRSYPYGYGAFGLGYFYYDPYSWYPGGYSTYAGPGYYSQSYGYPRSYGYGFDIGELRLQVSPRHAQVFVDGYYAGTVDDYDGAFQSLKLESGPYQIEIAAPGYETLAFDVRISPGQKINYRGDLPRRP